MLLQTTEEVAKARLNVSEMLLSQVSEEMRQQRRIKEQSFKRVSAPGEGVRVCGVCAPIVNGQASFHSQGTLYHMYTVYCNHW